MARQNTVFLYARVSKVPKIDRNSETGEYNYGMMYVDVVRGPRDVGDDVNYPKHDHPLIISREKELLDKMAVLKENSIVYIKGVLSTKKMTKRSFCPNCTDEDGNARENLVEGNLVFVTPIYIEHVKDYLEKSEAVEDIVKNREISNQLYVIGDLLKDPKLVTTKKGLRFTQYPIAINRKYTIRTDDPSIKTDWPVVKSYGENALEDKMRLMYQSTVMIDGCLQARRVHRKKKCDFCGEEYTWDDNLMEIVPYAMEYLGEYKSDDDIEKERQQTAEEYRQMLFDGYKDDITDKESDEFHLDTDEANE